MNYPWQSILEKPIWMNLWGNLCSNFFPEISVNSNHAWHVVYMCRYFKCFEKTRIGKKRNCNLIYQFRIGTRFCWFRIRFQILGNLFRRVWGLTPFSKVWNPTAEKILNVKNFMKFTPGSSRILQITCLLVYHAGQQKIVSGKRRLEYRILGNLNFPPPLKFWIVAGEFFNK